MRIFLDVGGHSGQTVQAVLDPSYGFARIVTFEPVESLVPALRGIQDARIEVVNAGLSNRTGTAVMHGCGSLGGSLFDDAPNAEGPTAACRVIEASEWFRQNVGDHDEVYLKLNCEGSECDILENLLDSGQFGRVTQVLVDFDAMKIPSQRHRVHGLQERLKAEAAANCKFPSEVMYGMGSHFGGIRNWLNTVGARQAGVRPCVSSTLYHLTNLLRRRHLPFYKLQILRRLPRSLVARYYRVRGAP